MNLVNANAKSTDVVGFDVTNFEEDVLIASKSRPVVVDFWAPWCGPCRVLGPVLEKLALEQSERWTLVKVNTEQFQDLSIQYGIRGIPAVKLFVDAQVTDEFTGALPEAAVRQWLDTAIPGEGSKLLSSAEAFLESGDQNAAMVILEQIVADEPTNPLAAGLLALCLAFLNPQRAASLARTAASSEPRFAVISEAIHTLDGYRNRIQSEKPFADESGRADFIRALTALSDNRLEEVVMALLEVIKTNRYYEDDASRKIGVAVFTLLGNRHPLTRSYRRTFDMWLT